MERRAFLTSKGQGTPGGALSYQTCISSSVERLYFKQNVAGSNQHTKLNAKSPPPTGESGLIPLFFGRKGTLEARKAEGV